MRYITNAEGYLVTVSFGADVACVHGVCTEYEGGVPAGYASLDAWYVSESEKLHRWKVVEGELTKDEEAPKPPQCDSWVDRIYPVGSIYMSVSPTDPADLFGGTWERIEDTFLLAAGSTYEAGTTGGEAEHTLTVDELPSHRHMMNGVEVSFHEGGWVAARSATFSQQTDDGTTYTDYEGGGAAHNNMPPYLAVYMWKRVEDPVPEEPDSGLIVTDDGAGNVTIEAYGPAASITDDGAGNVRVWAPGAVEADGAGNVTIL